MEVSCTCQGMVPDEQIGGGHKVFSCRNYRSMAGGHSTVVFGGLLRGKVADVESTMVSMTPKSAERALVLFATCAWKNALGLPELPAQVKMPEAKHDKTRVMNPREKSTLESVG